MALIGERDFREINVKIRRRRSSSPRRRRVLLLLLREPQLPPPPPTCVMFSDECVKPVGGEVTIIRLAS